MKLNDNLDANNVARIINLPTPSASGDATPKSYVDAMKAALAWRDPARVASVANITISNPGTATFDGVVLANGDRILLKDQTAGAENGIYQFNGSAVAMTRTTDVIKAGLAITVDEGSVNADTVWLLTTNDPIVVGTTALTFGALGVTVTAGTGLQKVGNTLSLVTPVGVTNGGTGGTTAAAARANLGAVGKFGQDFGDGSSTSFAITHNLGTTDVQVEIFLKSTGAQEICDVTMTSTNVVTLSGWSTAPAANAYRVVVIG